MLLLQAIQNVIEPLLFLDMVHTSPACYVTPSLADDRVCVKTAAGTGLAGMTYTSSPRRVTPSLADDTICVSPAAGHKTC